MRALDFHVLLLTVLVLAGILYPPIPKEVRERLDNYEKMLINEQEYAMELRGQIRALERRECRTTMIGEER